jgi:hypothetical protein
VRETHDTKAVDDCFHTQLCATWNLAPGLVLPDNQDGWAGTRGTGAGFYHSNRAVCMPSNMACHTRLLLVRGDKNKQRRLVFYLRY